MICILGGTFDPIHYGHLRAALEVMTHLGPDEVRFVPCRVPPHRRMPGAAAEHRLAMVELAVDGQPGFAVDRRELDREGPSYSVDTLENLRAETGAQRALCLVVGMDAFAGLPAWHRWQDILGLAHVVVVHRPGSPDLGEAGARVSPAITGDPGALHAGPCGAVFFQPVTSLDISATAIRDMLNRGESPRYLLPDNVIDYIRTHRLYAKTGSAGGAAPGHTRDRHPATG